MPTSYMRLRTPSQVKDQDARRLQNLKEPPGTGPRQGSGKGCQPLLRGQWPVVEPVVGVEVRAVTTGAVLLLLVQAVAVVVQ